MTDPAIATVQDPALPTTTASETGSWRNGRIVFGVLSIGWLAFLLLGKVNARFWISGEHQIAWKSVRGIWAIQLDELPGGAAIQWLVAGSMAVFVVGVIVALYLLLVAAGEDQGESVEAPGSVTT